MVSDGSRGQKLLGPLGTQSSLGGSQQDNRDLSPRTVKNQLLAPHKPGRRPQAPKGNGTAADPDCSLGDPDRGPGEAVPGALTHGSVGGLKRVLLGQVRQW